MITLSKGEAKKTVRELLHHFRQEMMMAWTRMVEEVVKVIVNLEYIYKIEPPGFGGGLDMGCNRMRIG